MTNNQLIPSELRLSDDNRYCFVEYLIDGQWFVYQIEFDSGEVKSVIEFAPTKSEHEAGAGNIRRITIDERGEYAAILFNNGDIRLYCIKDNQLTEGIREFD